MTVAELLKMPALVVANDGENGETALSGVYCCDLLSCVMGECPADSVWITVMNNINTLAVASLTDCAAVVLACGIKPDGAMIAKAQQQGITLLTSEQPVFETALSIHNLL